MLLFSSTSFSVYKQCKKLYKVYKKIPNSVESIRTFKDVRFDDIPDVSPTIIRGRFKKYDVKFEEGCTNFIVGCPVCESAKKESLSDKAKIFINKKTGAFTCEACHHTGSWNEMECYFSSINSSKKSEIRRRDPVIIKELNKQTLFLRNMKNNTISCKDLEEETYKQIQGKFNFLDSIPKSTLEEIGAKVDITHSHLYFPLYNSAYILVGYKVFKVKGKEAIEPALEYTASSGVLYLRGSRSSSTVIVVANIQDFLFIVNAQLNYHVICLPNGLQTLSLHTLPCFERFNKLILWFGNDITAWETTCNFSKKLGERRCLFIRPNMENIQDFKTAISNAQPIWHKSITTFASLRADVLNDLQNIERVQGVKWQRFPSLNRILRGHRRGELTVFTGPTGSGKTTFISEYSLDLAMQGVSTLWGSFEIRNARLARTMLQQMSGLPLEEHLDKYDFWADKFEDLPIYYMTFHGQQSIKIVMEAIEHAVYVHDIAHVIIDNLQFMMGMSEDARHVDRFWKQDVIVANFRTFATRRNCHVTLVIHPRKEREAEDLTMSSIFGGAKASQEADNILIIQDKRLSSLKGKKYLQICKNRYTGDLGVMPLDFDKDSLSFVQKKERKKKDEPSSASE